MILCIAILIGKIISFLTRTLNLGGGSAAPGLYALKIDPNLVEKLSTKIPKNIIITGTNGKTTTARMVTHFAKQSGLKVIRNHTGSNLERGIASALITNSGKFDLGIWELDEAAFNSVAPKIKPDTVVFLNVFRDQLDRYGEVNSVVKRWTETLEKLPKETVVLVNGDDENTLRLKDHFKGQVETFGVEGFKIAGESIERRKTQPKLDFEAKNVKLDGLKGSTFRLNKLVKLPLPGIYHVYDSVAAIAVASYLNLKPKLANYQPAFGRFEKLTLPAGRQAFGAIFLIKNPAGATQVFETINPNLKPEDRLLLALNDNLADGTDVSWIWDANFELLCHPALSIPLDSGSIVVSGTRAADLAVRLKYAGFKPSKVTVIPDLKMALREARKGLKGSLYILPTYTAMLALQGILTKQGIKQKYWEEN